MMLIRYFLATRKAFEKKTKLSVALDAASTGKRRRMFGSFGLPDNTAAWAPPLVRAFPRKVSPSAVDVPTPTAAPAKHCARAPTNAVIPILPPWPAADLLGSPMGH